MANPPHLQVSGLPPLGAEEAAATASPARGAEMLNFLQTRLHQKNRAPPLVHSWEFWHDRQDRSANSNGHSSSNDRTYEDRLESLAQISDVKQFWSVFNNFNINELMLRDSVHLFHKGVKPVWEDPRNARGGSWTFRVPKSHAAEFWKEICMLAIGEQLQETIEEPERKTFRDDICGVNLGVRFNSMLVQIWNRDGDHTAGVDRILQTVLGSLSEELKPREGSYYYKKHAEHNGFGEKTGEAIKPTVASSDAGTLGTYSLNGAVNGS